MLDSNVHFFLGCTDKFSKISVVSYWAALEFFGISLIAIQVGLVNWLGLLGWLTK